MPVSTTQSKILIAGTRGIPHQHGGFESFAQHLALHLVAVGRNATVACQRDDSRRRFTTEYWHGVKLLKVTAFFFWPIGLIIFDLFTAIFAIFNRPIVLTLGYNTAFIFLLYKAFRVTNIVNMDGVEWRRNKWSKPVKVWFYINERLAMWLGDVLVADHPVIAERLCHKVDPAKVVTIPYGAHRMDKPKAEVLQEAGL